jgi:hypothetical protein
MELYRRFFPEASDVEACDSVDAFRSAETMAEFQGLLLGMAQDSTGTHVVKRGALRGVLDGEVESVSV